MASIHGFELKNMKRISGTEGHGLSGDVWLNGTKLGHWSQDANGGCSFADFEIDTVDESVAKQCPEYSADVNGIHFDASLDAVLTRLAAMKDDERGFKRAVRNGHTGTIVVSDGMTVLTACYDGNQNDETNKHLVDYIVKKYGMNGDGVTVEFHDSLDDFSVGTPIHVDGIA